jgi:uncharacterized delta-60 repeat protein
MRVSLLFCLFLLVLPGMAQQPGDLDLSFDGDGKVVLDLDDLGQLSSSDDPTKTAPYVVVTNDLKLIVAYWRLENGLYYTSLLRLNEDGSLDTTYGINGIAASSISGKIAGMVKTEDDKVVMLIQGNDSLTSNGLLLKYADNGQLDSSFGTFGQFSIPTIPNTITYPFNGLKALPDGKLLCFRGAWSSSLLIRSNLNGSIDTSFGDNGVLQVVGAIHDVAVTPTGRIRWVPMQNDTPFEVDYNSQEAAIAYTVSPDHTAPPQLYHRLVINGAGTMFGQSPIGVNCYCCSSRSGFGRAPEFSPNWWNGNNFTTITTAEIFWAVGCGNTYIYGERGPVSVDQDGNFFGAYTITSVSSNSPWILDPSWTLRKYFSSGQMVDYDFGTPYTNAFGGVRTSFDTTAFPYPTSTCVQPDGKVLVAGHCEIQGIRRVILARYHNIPDPRSKLHLKMFLGGPYDPDTGLMSDHLRQLSLIPFIQPYQPPAFQPKNGVGTWGLGAGVLNMQGDSAVVDWVWLELLDPDSVALVKATRVGLLHRNGSVTAADGVSPIDFSVGAGSYFLRVRHRNHLSVTLTDPITLGLDPIEVDLTSPATATFGTNAQMEMDGVMMLWPGNATGNDEVKYMGAQNDRDAILISIGGMVPTATATGYLKQDVNLDGEVKYIGPSNDRDVILQTIGGDVPTAVRVEQTP